MPRPRDSRSTNGAAKADTKMRRSHRKSRNGCSECKRRHIRCDETRPACTNCAIAERTCAYPATASLQQPAQAPSPASTSQVQSPAGSYAGASIYGGAVRPTEAPGAALSSSSNTPGEEYHRQGHMPPVATTPALTATPAPTLPSFHDAFDTGPMSSQQQQQPQQQQQASGGNTFMAHHLVLFHHAMSEMSNAMLVKGTTSSFIEIAVRYVQDAPYVLDQVLALAALHRARLYPEAAAALRHQATELQNRAVPAFMRESANLPDELHNCIPRFLFSSSLSLHVLAETLAYYRLDFHSFIARFVECIELSRGVLSVSRPHWPYLIQTELEPFLTVTNEVSEKTRDPPGDECAPLERLMADSDLSDSSIAACRGAITRLQWAFDLHAKLDDPEAPHAASSFTVTVGADYVDVLRRKQPEALIILAYYGVLVHRSRRFWVFEGDKGVYMVRAIAQYLGDGHWSGPMRWPLEVIENEKD